MISEFESGRRKGMRDYTKIEAWRRADDLVVAIYEHTRKFPKEELYGLTTQLRRAALSVPANIAEGSARGSKRDYLHFLYIARGSLTETQYFVHLALPSTFPLLHSKATAQIRDGRAPSREGQVRARWLSPFPTNSG
jgi:four helix bundle protein